MHHFKGCLRVKRASYTHTPHISLSIVPYSATYSSICVLMGVDRKNPLEVVRARRTKLFDLHVS
jgi:hypothetical protein